MYKEQIEAYFDVHKDEMVKDIMNMVSIRSVEEAAQPGKPFGEGPAAALDAALKLAEKHGFENIRNFDNYVGHRYFWAKAM